MFFGRRPKSLVFFKGFPLCFSQGFDSSRLTVFPKLLNDEPFGLVGPFLAKNTWQSLGVFLKTKTLSSKTPLLGGGPLDFILVSAYPTMGKRFFNISKVAFSNIPLLGGGSLNQKFSDPPSNKGKLKIS